MELTVQIVTKNHENEIVKTIQSLAPIASQIIVGDMGSTDGTLAVANANGAKIVNLSHYRDRSEARNVLTQQARTDLQLYLHPGEVIIQGQEHLLKPVSPSYLSILQDNTLSKEIRLWSKSSNIKFYNPIYEFLDCSTNHELPVIIYNEGKTNYSENLQVIESWKATNPLAKEPHYFQALTLLGQQRYDEFLKVADHYLFIENKMSPSTIMTRYYYALVMIMHKKKVKPALQNINICLCYKPLMAEFWCLIGDVYYHLLHKFDQAKEFYEMAIILGSRRLTSDKWPMDISKYKEYPEKMIESCNLILVSKSGYLV